MRILTLIWLGFVALLVLGSSGCVVSSWPVIARGAGEDLGETFEFFSYRPDDDPSLRYHFELTRQQASGYVLQIYFLGQTRCMLDQSFAAELLRLGNRQTEPIYLLQAGPQIPLQDIPPLARPAVKAIAEAGLDHFLAIVAMRKDGVGVLAVIDCKKPEVTALAEQFGVALGCDGDLGGLGWSRIANHPNANQVLDFFRAGLAGGLFGWEDELGVSVIDKISI